MVTAGGVKAHAVRICSSKGGGGKTLLAINLAVALADLGHKVLLLDVDPYSGGIADQLRLPNAKVPFTEIVAKGIDAREAVYHYNEGNIDIIYENANFRPYYRPENMNVKAASTSIIELGYDYIIADSASGNLVESAIKFYDEFMDIVVPVSDVVLSEAKLIKRYDSLGLKYRIVLNNVGENARVELSTKEIESMLSKHIDAVIPHDEKVMESTAARKPAYLINKKSKFSIAIKKLADLYI